MSSFEKNCTIIIKTIYRPNQLFETVKAWRNFYPNIRIIVLDDGDDAVINMAHYENDDIEYIAAPLDIGLSAGRNILVSSVKTPYFFLTDDDDMPCGRDFDDIFLEIEKSNYDIVGIRIDDRVLNLSMGHKEFRVGVTKIENSKPHRIIPCNIIRNLFIGKRNTIVPWQAQLKCGEHEAYFIDSYAKKIKIGLYSKKIKYKVTQSRPSEKYKILRSREDDLKIAHFKLFTNIEHFYLKWGMERKVEHYNVKGAKLKFKRDTRLDTDIAVLTNKNKYLVNPRIISKPVECQLETINWNFISIPGTDSVHLNIEAVLAGVKLNNMGDNIHDNPKINCFTIVRNPYDRMIAVAKDFYRFNSGDIAKLTDEKINDTISNNIGNIEDVSNNIKGGNFTPQVNFSKSAHKIFHYERGFGEIQEFFDQEGINISVLGKKLRYENKFKLTTKTKKLIYEMHGIDFETFGYKE